jgi:hypothetical protein
VHASDASDASPELPHCGISASLFLDSAWPSFHTLCAGPRLPTFSNQTMSDDPSAVESGRGYERDPVLSADERKLNEIGYVQEFKRDMSAAG